jgi:hypothetical protein
VRVPRATTTNWISVLPAVLLEGYIVSIAQEGTVCCLDLENFLEVQLVSLLVLTQLDVGNVLLLLMYDVSSPT